MIQEVTGDLFKSNCKILCHQVNCKGVMGSGVAKQVKEKYPEVYTYYRNICNRFGWAVLGTVVYNECNDGHVIANLFGQDEFGWGRQCTDYTALESCIKAVHDRVVESGESVAFPYLVGCGRGGGSWEVVFELIKKYFDGSDTVCEVVHFADK